MIRRHITVLRLTLMAADALLAGAVFAVVSVVRFGDDWLGVWGRTGIPAPVGMAAWAIAWVTTLWVHGLYRLRTHWSIQADIARLVQAALLIAIVVFVVLFAAQLPQVSRLFLIGLFVAQLVVALSARLVIRVAFRQLRERGLSSRYILVAGTSPMAQAFADLIESHRELGLKVLGHLGRGGRPGEPPPTRPILGRLEDVETILHSHVVDEVAICLQLADWPLVEAITRICAEEGKVVRMPADGPVPHLEGADVEHYGGLTIQSLVYGPDRTLSLLAKRTIDVVSATAIALLASPALLVIGAAIRLTAGPPIFFHQERVGLNGRTFRVLKFRTMVPDAEQRLADLIPRNEISGHAFKVTDDPRVFRVGRFLRRTSLDEVPQLWNVIRGEMSLVGPRPPLPREVAGYDVWHRRRLSMKPGITGLWQVSARHSPDFNHWVAIDLDYIDRWSLWLDLKILARTVPAMLHGR